MQIRKRWKLFRLYLRYVNRDPYDVNANKKLVTKIDELAEEVGQQS